MYIDIDRHPSLASQHILKYANGQQILYVLAADNVEGWYIQRERSRHPTLRFGPIRWHRIDWASTHAASATPGNAAEARPDSLIGCWASITNTHHSRYSELKDFELLIETVITPGCYRLSIPGLSDRPLLDPVILSRTEFELHEAAPDPGPFPTSAYTGSPTR